MGYFDMESDMFYQSMFIMTYAYYESYLYLLAHQANIKSTCVSDIAAALKVELSEKAKENTKELYDNTSVY